ncbi:hypothetical protein HUR95_00615 [Caldalkalibacillus thermarum TA2.A1]|nr:hypothetical protein [Caldalkalibacillus thermarum]QZT33977.1 hypothetical protein HUR95_00615 [Caldalkalibacillus thermarum TA2.A1]
MRLLLVMLGILLLVGCTEQQETQEYLEYRYKLETIRYMEAACLYFAPLHEKNVALEKMKKQYVEQVDAFARFQKEHEHLDWVPEYIAMLKKGMKIGLDENRIEESVEACKKAVAFREKHYDAP